MALLFSHEFMSSQEDDAMDSLGVKRFISLPKELKGTWANIPPNAESSEFNKLLKSIMVWLSKTLDRGDFVLVQGDFGATVFMVQFCWNERFIPVYATTERHVLEKKVEDKVELVHTFQHVRYRRYPRFRSSDVV